MRAVSDITTAKMSRKIIGAYGSGGKEGARAVAAQVIGPWIETEIPQESILDLVLDRKPPRVGEVKWPKPTKHRAFFIDEGGNLRASRAGKRYVIPEGYLCTCRIVTSELDLKRGDVPAIEDQKNDAKRDMLDKLHDKLFTLLLGSVDSSMVVNISGTSLTKAGLNQALAKLEDKKIRPSMFFMRGSRFSDIRDLTTPSEVAADLFRYGVEKFSFGGANFMFRTELETTQLVLLGHKKPGRVMTEFPLTERDAIVGERLDIEIPMYQVEKMAITNPDWYVVINITG